MDYKVYFENYSNDIRKLLSEVDTNLIKDTVDIIKQKIDYNLKTKQLTL